MGLAKTWVIEPFGRLGLGFRVDRDVAQVAMTKSAGALDFAVAASRHELAQLEPEWNALHAKMSGAPSLFLSFNWIWHWSKHYLDQDRKRLAVIAGRHRGELVMVLPMVIEHSFGLRTASLAGAPVSQYGDILIDQSDPEHQSWLAESWQYLRAELAPDMVHLRKVRSGSAAAKLMQLAGGKETNTQAAPFIALAGELDFETFDQRFSAKDRKNRRRKRKRLLELGTVGFRRSAGSAAASEAFNTAMCWKRSWLEDGARLSTALADLRFDRFFEEVLTNTDRPVGAEVFELTLDGKPIAVKVAITNDDYRGMHLTAFDKAYEKLSPGALLVEDMVGAGLTDGVATLDFLAPAYAYKLEWAAGSVAVADYSISVTPAGALYDSLYVQRLRPHLQTLAVKAPAPIRRLAAKLVKSGRKTPVAADGA